MKNKFHAISKIIAAVVLPLVIISCVNKELDNSDQEELTELNSYIDGKGFTDIGYGVYLKFHNRDGVDILDDNLQSGETFVINYEGVYLDGSVWETTDSLEGAILFPNRYVVYGPNQLRSGELSMFGLDTALKFFSVGDTGTVVIPSWYAWGDYTRVLHVGMQEVIENDTNNEESDFFDDYIPANGYNIADSLYTGVFWKNPIDPNYELSDTTVHSSEYPTVRIILTGRYAELYYSSNLGRIFYPLVEDSVEFERTVGDSYDYPVTNAIDSAILRMNVGDVLDLAGLSTTIGWGYDGYYHSTLNTNLVPEFMPVHFRLELVEVEEDE